MNLKKKITYLTGLLLPACLIVSSASADQNVKQTQVIWFENQIMQHPSMIAAKARLNMQLSLANASSQPIYNPELTSSYDREGDGNNYTVGFNQTIDLWDRRAILIEQAKFKKVEAKQNYAESYQETIANAFIALIHYQSAKHRLDLVKEQEIHMDELIDEIKKRQKVNELSELDLQISLFSISTKLNETALASVQFYNAQAQVKAILPNWNETSDINVEALLKSNSFDIKLPDHQTLLMLPKLKQAYAKMKIDEYQNQLEKLESKSDLTIGLTTGQSVNENTIGINFTFPLNIRNNFTDKVAASTSKQLASQANYASMVITKTSQIKAARSVMKQYIRQVKHWKRLTGNSGQRSLNLIESKWDAGDMSTTDYLLVLQQRIDGLTAAITLKQQAKLATIDYLKLTAQLAL